MKKKLLLPILLTFLSVYSFAQTTQTLRGTITDSETKSPIVGATIILLNTQPVKGTVTDFDGSFKIENVNAGRISIKVSFLGYKERVLSNLELNAGKELVLDIKLEESVEKLDEIVIKGNKKNESLNEMAVISARQFSVEETGRYAGALNDVSRMASNYAGVLKNDDSRNDIVIRGNSPNGLLWRLNEMDIPAPNHFSGMNDNGGPISMLNYNVLANSDFITAAFPAEYGNALSGVFDIKMRKGNNENREYMFQIGALGTEAMLEGPFSENYKGSYLINYRFSTTTILSAMGIDFGYDGEADYQDLSYNIELPLNDNRKISLFGLWGLSKYILNMEDITEESQDRSDANTNTDWTSSTAAFGLSYFHPVNNNTYIKTIFGVSRKADQGIIDSVSTTNNEEIPFFRSDNFANTFSIHSYLKHRVNAKNKLKAGVQLKEMAYEINEKRYNYDYSEIRNERTTDGSTRIAQAYLQWKYLPTDNIQINGGLFSQYLFLNETHTFEPRIGARWQVAANHAINAGYGRHSQSQPLQVYFYNTEIDSEIFHTNKNLDFSKSDHFVLGYNTTLFKDINLKAEVYYQNLFNIPIKANSEPSSYSLINNGGMFGMISEDSLVNNGVGRNYGVEMTIEKYFSKGYYYLITASVFESEYKGSDDVWRNTAFNGNYALNFLAGKEFKTGANSKIIFDIKLTTAGGKRYSPIDLQRTLETGDIVEVDDEAYSRQFDPYFRTDVKLSYRWNRSKVAHEFFINIDNVFNTENVFMQTFNTTTLQVENVNQTGFFPTFQYKIYF